MTGESVTIQHVVTHGDTARSLGSGDVEVLGTPKLVALFEQAAVELVGPEKTTVGVHVHIEHLAPTPVGRTVLVTATLVANEGRRLAFEIEGADDAGTIAKGTHVRVVVERDEFEKSAHARH